MKNIFTSTIILVLILIDLNTIAQGVAINADNSVPDPSAMLDVKSTNKGLLVPGMTQAQRNAIASPANGLMICQTNNSPGFYYNSGSGASPVWVIAGTGTFWGLSGNSGTSASTNYIGTTDNQPLRLRVNNFRASEIHPSGNLFLGLGSGQSNTGGLENTAIGEQALCSNTAGNFNSVFETSTLTNNIFSDHAQITINTDGSIPDNSAMLDVKTAISGMLLPGITIAHRNAKKMETNNFKI